MQLRFASLTVTSSREDFHLLVNAHAGRTYWVARSRPGDDSGVCASGALHYHEG